MGLVRLHHAARPGRGDRDPPLPPAMRLLPIALATLAALAASGQPVAADSVAARPAFAVPVTGDFEPPQTSAALAYAYSALATAAPVAAGLALDSAFGPDPESGSNRPAAVVLVLGGAWFGPLAGNLSLGAGADARRAFLLSGGGFVAGVAIAGAGVAITGVCVVGDLADGVLGSGDCAVGPAATALFVVAAATAALGTAAGAAYSLATVPANAERARRYRQVHSSVSAAPGWRAGGPALAVRVGL